MYPELTNPGDRQRYLGVEYDVPTEIVGGEDTFKNGLAPRGPEPPPTRRRLTAYS